MEKIENTENQLEVTWIRPDLDRERGEIERVLKEFLGQEPNEENIRNFEIAVNNTTKVELSDEQWESLENTDSFHNVRPGHLEDVTNILDASNQELSPKNRRDLKKHLGRFIGNTPIEAPIIVKNKDGKLHLVSGNTRLMVCRLLGIRPKVIIAEFNC